MAGSADSLSLLAWPGRWPLLLQPQLTRCSWCISLLVAPLAPTSGLWIITAGWREPLFLCFKEGKLRIVGSSTTSQGQAHAIKAQNDNEGLEPGPRTLTSDLNSNLNITGYVPVILALGRWRQEEA